MESVHFNSLTGTFDSGLGSPIVTEQPLYRSPAYEDTGKRYEITPGSGEGLKVTSKTSTVTSGSLGIKSEGVLSSATNNGFAVRLGSEVKDSTVVRVNGMEMTARSAAECGYLTRNHDGSYRELQGNPLEAQKKDEVGEPQLDGDDAYNPALSSSEIETALEAASQELGGYEGLDRMALSAISGLTKGDTSAAVRTLASAAGVEPAEAESFISGLYDGFRSQSAKYIQEKHGVSGEEVFDWAAHSLSPSEKASLYYRVYLGRSKCLDDLVTKYQRFGRR